MQKNKVQEFVEALFGKLHLDLQSITIEQLTELEWYCNVESGDETLLLGWHGDVVKSLQHVIKTVARCQGWVEDEEMMKFDVCGYRKRQEQNVREMTEQKCDEVISTGRSVVLPPMSPYFRRIVHVSIVERFPKLTSSSEGTGDFRSVRISKK